MSELGIVFVGFRPIVLLVFYCFSERIEPTNCVTFVQTDCRGEAYLE